MAKKKAWEVVAITQIDMDEMMGQNPEYDAFVDKFKPKLTTDDCYTPPNVYEAVRAWVFKRYGLAEDTQVVRPFWPGGDYKAFDYPDGCVVIDNPPFSIMGQIETFYLKNGIDFFLFAPALTLFKPYDGLNYVLIDVSITYENGAQVATGFVTNMGEYLVEVSAELHAAVGKADKANREARTKKVPKYETPAEVVTSAKIRQLASKGVSYEIKAEEAAFVRTLDSMSEKKKCLFGNGFLISQEAAIRKVQAERMAEENAVMIEKNKKAVAKAETIYWELSEKEREAVQKLGKQ